MCCTTKHVNKFEIVNFRITYARRRDILIRYMYFLEFGFGYCFKVVTIS